MNVIAQAENLNASSAIYQLSNCSLHMHRAINDAASDDRAEICSISNDRRRVAITQANETNKACKYTCTCMNICV